MPTLTWLTRKEDIKVSGQVPYRILDTVEKGVYGDSKCRQFDSVPGHHFLIVSVGLSTN